jgi:alkanesulfonate monooxygenase SsuD/methylene tetrahydromethanopterin reductase-like flavin-dependent oxidoreductase (luciferase family)
VRFGFFSVQDFHPELEIVPRVYFEQVLVRIRQAEALGYESFWLAEHHFHTYGLNPAPPVLLAAAARETSRIRLGSAIAVLPFHHPIHLAEHYAMLDICSNGRLNFGVGSGYLQHEFDGFSVPPADKSARFEEVLDVVLKAWSGARFTHTGRFYQLGELQLQVVPIQQPHPPIFVGILRAESAYRVGRQGRQIMAVPYTAVEHLSDMGEVIAEFRRGYAEAGCDPAQARIPLTLHTFIARTDGDAERLARGALDRYVRTRLYARREILWDQLQERRLVAIGGPERVVSTIELLRRAGATDVLCLMDFGGLEHETVMQSMELFAREVVPRFQ